MLKALNPKNSSIMCDTLPPPPPVRWWGFYQVGVKSIWKPPPGGQRKWSNIPTPGAENVRYVCTTRFIESVRGTHTDKIKNFSIFNLKKVLVSGPKCCILKFLSGWRWERIVEMSAPARTSFKKKLKTGDGQCAPPRNPPYGQIPHPQVKQSGQNPRGLRGGGGGGGVTWGFMGASSSGGPELMSQGSKSTTVALC